MKYRVYMNRGGIGYPITVPISKNWAEIIIAAISPFEAGELSLVEVKED